MGRIRGKARVSGHHTLPKSRLFVFGLQFCCRQYGTNFKHFDVVGAHGAKGAKARDFVEITLFKSSKVVDFGALYLTFYY